ncbi:MAG: hypothetical protein AAF802_28460 [Planctomycetota bacterium]
MFKKKIISMKCQFAFVFTCLITSQIDCSCTLAEIVGFSRDTEQLIAIDPVTGQGSVIGGSTAFARVEGIATSPSGEIFAVEAGSSSGDSLVKIDPNTGARTFVTTTSRVNGAVGLSFGPNGDLFFANISSNQLWELSLTSGELTSPQSSEARGENNLKNSKTLGIAAVYWRLSELQRTHGKEGFE